MHGNSSVMSSLSREPYEAAALLDRLQNEAAHFRAIDDAALCEAVGSSKVLNVCMLAAAVQLSQGQDYGLAGAVGIDELRAALKLCVKERFVSLNEAAVDATVEALK